MLASAGQPSLHGCIACMVRWTKGALRRICRQKNSETSFSFSWFFCLVVIQGNGVGVLIPLARVNWEGQASWASSPAQLCRCWGS